MNDDHKPTSGLFSDEAGKTMKGLIDSARAMSDKMTRMSARIAAYEAVLDEIMATTTDSRARTMASGVLSDYMERTHERGTA